jgi:RND family efflux transporter MFP subunit
MVTTKTIESGGAVSENETIFELDDDSALVVRARVSELDVVHLQTGRSVPMQVDAYPGVELTGKIRRIFPSADAASRLVPVEVVLEKRPPGIDVRPGFLARMDFVLERRDGVLAVPAASIGVSQSGSFVYVVESGALVRREVETGLTASGWVEVMRGLTAEEQVVSSGHMNLREGLAVRISSKSTAEAAGE